MKKKIKGIVLIILSMAIAWGSTYLYDLIAGNEGREFVVVLFTAMICIILFLAGTFHMIEVCQDK